MQFVIYLVTVSTIDEIFHLLILKFFVALLKFFVNE